MASRAQESDLLLRLGVGGEGEKHIAFAGEHFFGSSGNPHEDRAGRSGISSPTVLKTLVRIAQRGGVGLVGKRLHHRKHALTRRLRDSRVACGHTRHRAHGHTDELEDIGWPIWTRAITARGTHTMFSSRKDELSINVPISCGGVSVNPGDFIVADGIGVVVVPLAEAETVLKAAREQADREQSTREWVAKGKTIDDLLAEFGRL